MKSMPRKGKAEIRAGRVDVAGHDVFVVSLPSLAECLPEDLTMAERDVAALLLEGLSNRAVASLRGTSVRTIANQVGAIFRKLRVNGRVELGQALLLRSVDE
jgi:DNA-binding NarL/FixJ family response regulator